MQVTATMFLKRFLRPSIVSVVASCFPHFIPILNMAEMSLQKALNASADNSTTCDSTSVSWAAPEPLESALSSAAFCS